MSSCTVCYVLGGIFCRRRCMMCTQSNVVATRRAPRSDLARSVSTPKLYSMLHLRLILLAHLGSMGCNVQSALHHHLNPPCPTLGFTCKACKQPSPTNYSQNFHARNLRLCLFGGKLDASRFEDNLMSPRNMESAVRHDCNSPNK
jgi:hypothetical protein